MATTTIGGMNNLSDWKREEEDESQGEYEEREEEDKKVGRRKPARQTSVNKKEEVLLFGSSWRPRRESGSEHSSARMVCLNRIPFPARFRQR